jgi:hypothetical protein
VHEESSFQDVPCVTDVGSAETWLANQNIKIDIEIRLSEILLSAALAQKEFLSLISVGIHLTGKPLPINFGTPAKSLEPLIKIHSGRA